MPVNRPGKRPRDESFIDAPHIRAFRVSARSGHEYPRRAKAGDPPRATWMAFQERGNVAAVDADTLAIGNEAAAGGVPPSAAAARPQRV